MAKTLRQTLRGGRRLYELAARVDRFAQDIALAERQPWSDRLDVGRIKGLLDETRRALLEAAPCGLCDCDAPSGQCPKCNGKRWLSGRDTKNLRERKNAEQ